MTTAIKAIPTTYRGIRMRSRLEAKWAAMFDQFNWPWEYEPFELNGYIPDFVVAFPVATTLFEIKPAMQLSEFENHQPKIDGSGWDKPAVILGATLLDDGYFGHPIIGQCFAKSDRWTASPKDLEPWELEMAPEFNIQLPHWERCELGWCRRCEKAILCQSNIDSWFPWFRCQFCGNDDKPYNADPPIPFRTMWNNVKNANQWKPA